MIERVNENPQSLEKIVGGKIEQRAGIPFIVIEKTFKELDCGNVGTYIDEHYSSLTRKTLGNVNPLYTSMLKKNMLFCDIETAGRAHRSPIISISLAQINHTIKVKCALARDYGEEEGILRYFMEHLTPDTFLFTYNGNSCEIPRLEHQLQAKNLLNHVKKHLKEMMHGRHCDLYPFTKKLLPRIHKGITSFRLQDIVKDIFNEYRSGDIRSSDIPNTYVRYVEGEDIQHQLKRIIEHNMKDVVDLVALLTYLCLEGKKPSQ